jgi:hypothetical protein
MQLNPDQAERLCALLRITRPFAHLPVTNRPMTTLWAAMDDALMALRMPLYHKRLGKAPPKSADSAKAIQAGLALLGAFASGFGTRQAIVSSRNGWIDRISFQPRPEGINWTAAYAISPQAPVRRASTAIPYAVSIEDFLHLSAKVIYAVAGYNAGAIPDVTATYAFDLTHATIRVAVVVREHGVQTSRTSSQL